MATKKKKELDEEHEARVLEKIRADLAEYRPGLWAERVGYGPGCTCGLKTSSTCHRHVMPPTNDEKADVRKKLPEVDIDRRAA